MIYFVYDFRSMLFCIVYFDDFIVLLENCEVFENNLQRFLPVMRIHSKVLLFDEIFDPFPNDSLWEMPVIDLCDSKEDTLRSWLTSVAFVYITSIMFLCQLSPGLPSHQLRLSKDCLRPESATLAQWGFGTLHFFQQL